MDIFARWKAELDHAQKDKKYREWLDRCDKIVKRYRDERDAVEKTKRKLNIFWSNVQTLKPALYGRAPKPLVERRFLDRDPAARTASMVLERTLNFQMEVGYYNAAVDKAVVDYLLCGAGNVWVRYEPQFEEPPQATEPAEESTEESEPAEYAAVAYEKVCVDYVYYKDFLWSPSRCWRDVPWVAKRSYLTKEDVRRRFGDDAARHIKLDYVPDRFAEDDKEAGYFKKAEVWEIWSKRDRKVYFIAPASEGLVLEVKDDPLNLEGFWPCPEPLFATQTNDTLIPVPDYVEYQDQAHELDELTGRIDALTTAVKAAGVYDASYPALQRLLQEGSDNKLIGVDNWAAFAEKGGMAGAISLLPMKEIIEVLLRLHEARGAVKADLYEVTGISDIVRGYSGGSAKTATEQRIKGQFASLRLEDRRAAVARFCRDTLAIMAEIISEMFDETSLAEMSGYQQMVRDRVRKAVANVPQPDQQQGQQQQMLMQYEQAKMQVAQQVEQEAIAEFQQALEILRSDRLRGFRVDIETDSTIQVDAEADKQSATELVTSTLQGLASSAPLFAQAPEMVKPIGDLLMFAFRRFRVGRSLESQFEEAFDQIQERLENPEPQPDPEQIKAQAEVEKQQAETQRVQMNFQLEQQSKQMDLQMKREEHQMRLQEMQAEAALKRDALQLEEQKLALKERDMVMTAQMKAEERNA